MLFHWIKRQIPSSWLRPYHWLWAYASAWRYGMPSRAMRVIGVTGTNGKTSTTNYIGQLLMTLGETVGWTSSHDLRIADRVMLNREKMGMLGRGKTQRLLWEMKRNGCQWAIVETSSQGIVQYRHRGIAYDMAVVTNLTPEHLESHGGFDAYKAAKLELVKAVATRRVKTWDGRRVPTSVVVNANDAHARDFANVSVDTTIAFARQDQKEEDVHTDVRVEATDIVCTMEGTRAKVNGYEIQIPLLGSYAFSNALAAVTAVVSWGFDLSAVLEAAKSLKPVPGRMECLEHNGVRVVIDYAPEPYALDALYEALVPLKPKRIIHVGGACGGGRDTWKWSVLGEAAARRDDLVIVTNEDPYDDDPMMIINAIADACAAAGKQEGVALFRIEDRQEAIDKAVALSRPGDVILLTGKGSEPAMAVAGGVHLPWSEREAVLKAFAKHA